MRTAPNLMRAAALTALLLVLLVLLVQVAALAQGPLGQRAILAGGTAHVLLPPELACGPEVTQARWSSDGRYVLALCRSERVPASLARSRALRRDPGEPPGDVRLVTWSRDECRSREVWRAAIGRARVDEFQWLPSSDRAYALITESPTRAGDQPRRVMLWVQATAGTARKVTELPTDRLDVPEGEPQMGTNVDASPRAPIVLIQSWTLRFRSVRAPDGRERKHLETEDTLTPVRDDGALGPSIRIPGASIVAWSADGRTCYLSRTTWPTEPAVRPTTTYIELDPRTGQHRALPAEPPNLHSLMRTSYAPGQGPGDPDTLPLAPSGDLPVRLALTAAALAPGGADALQPLWLEAAAAPEPARALVCADARWARLSPAGDAVLYISQGVAWVRPVLRVTAAELITMKREEARRQALADAGVLSAALQNMVNSGEYYPKDDAQLREWLGPYLRGQAGLLDRLVYTHGAGRLLPAEAARTTVLGHVPGPGGRAVIFADGRAVWCDD